MIEKILTIAYLKFERVKARRVVIKTRSELKNAIHDVR